MSSEDSAAILQSIGHDIFNSFLGVTVETFLIAVYSVLVFKAGMVLLRKGRTKVSLGTFSAVFVMFGLVVSLWMIDIHNIIIEVQMTLLSTSTDSLDDLYTAAVFEVLRLASVEDAVYAYLALIGDGIIIWRVYAFWSNGRERMVILIPAAFLLGSTATSMMLSYCASRLGADIVLGTFQNPAFCRNIQTASYSTTLVTTAVATILLAYKTWEYRRTYLQAFGGSSKRTRVQTILMFLIESGVVYMLYFLVQVIMSLESVNESIERKPALVTALTIYQFTSSVIVGIYPTIIVLLVSSKQGSILSKTTSYSYRTTDHTNNGTLTHNAQTTGHSTSTMTSAPPRGVGETTVNLYEMARMTTGGSESKASDVKDGTLVVRVEDSQTTTYDV